MMEDKPVDDETLTQLLRDLYQTDDPYWDFTDFAAVQKCLEELQEGRTRINRIKAERAEMLAMLKLVSDEEYLEPRPRYCNKLDKLIARIEGNETK